MLCPKCKESTPLKRRKVADKTVILDQCTLCKGVWFDKGELEEMLGPNAERGFEVPDSSTTALGVECPTCSVLLYEFCYPGTLTLVDGCKQCAGVWLDHKEFKAINNARDDSQKISCPNCQARQQKTAESCTECGIVIAKRRSPGAQSKIIVSNREPSYADDIPGIKGSLLRGIDKAIKSLTAGLF